MVLDRFRKSVDPVLNSISRPFVFMHPNTITMISFLFSVLTGFFFYLGDYLLLYAFFFLFISSLLDAVDGKVARLRGIASKRGDFLDHIMDRYSDAIIVTGIAFSYYTHWYTAFFALTGIFFTSYSGTQAQAVTGKRDYGGILGRADRLVLFMILAIMQFLFMKFSIFSLSISDLFMIVIGFLGHVTAIQRILRTWGTL
ncbi:MAG: CDP-alcohol phosphatidyltransferase family protein [Thermoplasmata archaeon]